MIIVPVALAKLSGERHAPELPIPASAIRAYADGYGLTEAFVAMVQTYDQTYTSRIRDNAEMAAKQKRKTPSKAKPKKGRPRRGRA